VHYGLWKAVRHGLQKLFPRENGVYQILRLALDVLRAPLHYSLHPFMLAVLLFPHMRHRKLHRILHFSEVGHEVHRESVNLFLEYVANDWTNDLLFKDGRRVSVTALCGDQIRNLCTQSLVAWGQPEF
jgi:hypothetical protein